MDTRPTCFVIMPFSKTTDEHTEEYWTQHFTDFLKPLIEEGGQLEAKRSTALRGDLRNEIVADLMTAPIVVADLTDANPNVYWELGVRQSFRHGTVTIAEFLTSLPFDLSAKGTLFYHQDHIKNAKFMSQFKLSLQDCCDHPNRPDSLVLEVVSGRGSIYELVKRDEAMRRLEALIEELEFNLKRVSSITATARKNLEQPKQIFPATHLRLSCCELLMSTRYLEWDRTRYLRVERAYGNAAMLNGQLLVWEQKPKTTAKFVLQTEPRVIDAFASLLTDVRDALDELRRRA